VSQLEAASAVVTVEAWARTAEDAAALAAHIREAAYRRLRAEGVYA
jgi:hypothetical protein